MEEYIETVEVSIEQLRIDTSTLYDDETQELIQLNEQLRLLLDHIQTLKLQISGRISKIADCRLKAIGVGILDAQWNKEQINIYNEYEEVRATVVEYELDFELFQLEIEIYKRLIENEEQWRTQRILDLKQEFQESEHNVLKERTRYGNAQKEMESDIAKYNQTVLHYLELTKDLFIKRKEKSKYGLRVELIKMARLFYQRIRSSTIESFESLCNNAIDDKQFTELDLKDFIAHKRQEFEEFYGSINRVLDNYYKRKIHEFEIYGEKVIQYQRNLQTEKFEVNISELNQKIEKENECLSKERSVQVELEKELSELELKLKLIQDEVLKRSDAQKTEYADLQNGIIKIIYDIDEIRTNTIYLQTEIIIYGNILDVNGIQLPPSELAIESVAATTEKFIVKSEQHRNQSIGIEECDPSGSYVTILNHSENEDIDISGWKLKRYINPTEEISYEIPAGVILKHGKQLRIYSKLDTDTDGLESIHQNTVLPNQKIINANLVTWGMGIRIKTSLFDDNGVEKATHTQSLLFGTSDS